MLRSHNLMFMFRPLTLVFTLLISTPSFAADIAPQFGSRLRNTLELISTVPLSPSIAEGMQPSACRESGIGFAAWVERDGAFPKRRVMYGMLAGSPPRVSSGVFSVPFGNADQEAPQVSCRGRSVAILWTETEPDQKSSSIKIGFVDGLGALTNVAIVTTDAARKSEATFEWDGSEYLVAFSRSDQRMVTVKLNPATNVITQPIVVSEVPAFRGETTPRIAWSGKTFLLIWKYFIPSQCQLTCPDSQPALESRVLQRNGAPLGPATRLTDLLSGEYSLDWNGREFLVLFGGPVYTLNYRQGSFLYRFSESGTLTGQTKVSEYAGPTALFTRANETTTVHYEYVQPDSIRTVTVFDSNLLKKRQWTIGKLTPGGFHPPLLREIRSATGAKEFIFNEYDRTHNVQRLLVSSIDEDLPRQRSERRQ